ncbi:MAG TPA: DUF4129 domain-containing protein [Anaerolineales bacterium]|nr:DUF4129 domain-containing protein [Anaerolineales bacterium]
MIGRRWLLILCVFVLAAVAVLASSLHDVRFQPARALSFDQPGAAAPLPLSAEEAVTQTPLWKVLLFWAAFVINLLLFFWLMPPDMRKKVIRQMLSLALGMLAVLLALRYSLIDLPFLKSKPVDPSDPVPSGAGGDSPLPAFTAPHMAPWWVFAVSFLVLVSLLWLLWAAYRWWFRPARRHSELDAIRDIAQSSLGQIASGHDWGDVIIQSYVRMSEAVQAGRGLQRSRSSTPREFAERLEQAGLPAHAVQRLTRLFESARYGITGSSQDDIREAVACLNSILQACGQSQ